MKAIVIGGGISGVAAASCLQRHGVSTLLLESSESLGGRVGCVAYGERHVELGGRNVQANPEILRLFKEHGIEEFDGYSINSVAIGNRHHLDFRQTGGPLKRAWRFLQNLRRLGFRVLWRVRALAKAAQQSESGSQIGSPVWRALAEETGDVSTVHYFGATAAEGIFRPWTVRTMGSEPEEVYLGNLAPILGRGKVPIRRVRGGMHAFFQAAEKNLPVRLRHRFTKLLLENDRVAGVQGIDDQGRPFEERAELVVLALPAHAAAQLLAEQYPELSRTLQKIVYRPVATLIATYDSATFPGGLGGVFLPRGIPVSHISRQSGSDGTTVRYSFAGVASRPLLRPDSDEEELLAIAEKIMRDFGGELGARKHFVGRVWLPGVCGQSWMHHRTLDAISQALRAAKGLSLAGDYFQSASMDGCVLSAEKNVRAALSVLGTSTGR